MIRTILLIFFLNIFLPNQYCVAQLNGNLNTTCDLFGLYGIEVHNNSALDDFLISNNYCSLGSIQYPTFWGVGAQLNLQNSPFVGQFVFSHSNTNAKQEKMRSSISSYSMSVVMLYDICKSREWLLAPLCGFTVSNTSLTAVSNYQSSFLTSEPVEESLKLNFRPELKTGIALYRNIKICGYDFDIGVHTYYNFMILERSWRSSSDTKIAAVPSLGVHGLGVQFKIGVSIGNIVYRSERNTQ